MPLINTRGAASIKGFGFAGFSPTVPGAPTSVSASATSCSAISVSFTASTCNGGLSIDYYQAVCTGSGSHSATGSSPISITGLCASTSYTFKVRAHNSKGYGCYSSSTGTATTQVTSCSSSYTSPGSYTFTAPTGVTSVSVVAIGGGGAYQGCGGWLGYKNNISTSPGSGYTVQVGAGGVPNYSYSGYDGGGNSYFVNTSTVKGGGGAGGFGSWYNYSGGQLGFGGRVGDGGGRGGHGRWCLCAGLYPGGSAYNGARNTGGGGAGGYSGNGGEGATVNYNNTNNTTAGSSGSGGAGGGGSATVQYFCQYCSCCGGYIRQCRYWGGGGGGTGIFGQGANGGGSGGGGSGGSAGTCPGSYLGYGPGGAYGGGGGETPFTGRTPGAGGAVRVMWPGSSRSFPSTNAGSP